MNMYVTPSQGVVGDVGERGPPGPDGKEVRTVKCCTPSDFTSLVSCPSVEPLLLLLSYSVTSNVFIDFFKYKFRS